MTFCNSDVIVLTKKNWKDAANMVNAGLSVMSTEFHPQDRMAVAYGMLDKFGYVKDAKPWTVSSATVSFSRDKNGAPTVKMQVKPSVQTKILYTTMYTVIFVVLRIRLALFDFPIWCIRKLFRRR